jgi:hypothetical protein
MFTKLGHEGIYEYFTRDGNGGKRLAGSIWNIRNADGQPENRLASPMRGLVICHIILA